MARLLADENFPLPVVQELRRLGHDTMEWRATGFANLSCPDPFVLKFAAENARILLTLNRKDFIRLHQGNDDHAGIIVCTQDLDFIGQAVRIHNSLQVETDWKRKLLRINRPPIEMTESSSE